MPSTLPDPIMPCRFFQSAEISELEDALGHSRKGRQARPPSGQKTDWFDLFDEPEILPSSAVRGEYDHI